MVHAIDWGRERANNAAVVRWRGIHHFASQLGREEAEARWFGDARRWFGAAVARSGLR